MQDRGHHPDAIKAGSVAQFRRFGSRRRIKVFPHKARYPRAGAVAQIGNGGVGAVQVHRSICVPDQRIVQSGICTEQSVNVSLSSHH